MTLGVLLGLMVGTWGVGAWVYLCMEGLDDDHEA
ncbi:hypothetical protein KIY77_gp57 [Mycobacterium phage Mundrea]|uniref:Uncharacterized protein n=1 Tax=Mycobacterium phage Mundrea TaxID=1897540 RepID=A0A1C9LYL7_9CAUD|nr:hypothetical protein KIY77_gp57 [Mycobacterium phage Mundrea]AOQ27984.1 hypothetical protein SEA_MUNDREA_57 [Mycobacterium phage Mundrea]